MLISIICFFLFNLNSILKFKKKKKELNAMNCSGLAFPGFCAVRSLSAQSLSQTTAQRCPALKSRLFRSSPDVQTGTWDPAAGRRGPGGALLLLAGSACWHARVHRGVFFHREKIK